MSFSQHQPLTLEIVEGPVGFRLAYVDPFGIPLEYIQIGSHALLSENAAIYFQTRDDAERIECAARMMTRVLMGIRA